MLGWIIFAAIALIVMLLGVFADRLWGRGSRNGMSPEMEAEAANYVNYGRGPFVG